MRIAIVGSTHPYKGGIAQHTTVLAHKLQAAGHDVQLFSWKTQYPFFYPGQQFVPNNEPEVPPFPDTHRILSWKNPIGWTRLAKKLNDYDQVIFIWWVPTIQGPVYRTMLRSMGKRKARLTLLCHNVLPHELRRGDRQLARSVLGGMDEVVVHTEAQAEVARELSDTPVTVVKLPPTLPVDPETVERPKHRDGLLFFGVIRPYKGVKLLLQALAEVPQAKLTIAGEFWGSPQEYQDLIKQLRLGDRVAIRPGYLPAEEMVRLISEAEAVVLPYTSGTATWNATMAQAYGTPVIASTAGSLAEQVEDGVDGLLCSPGNVKELVDALKRFYEPGMSERLRSGIKPVDLAKDWHAYVSAVL